MIAGSWEVMIIYLAAMIPRPCGGAGRGVLADREAARMRGAGSGRGGRGGGRSGVHLDKGRESAWRRRSGCGEGLGAAGRRRGTLRHRAAPPPRMRLRCRNGLREEIRQIMAPPRFERATALTAQEMKGTLRREGLGAPGSCQTICTKMRKRKKLECAYNTSNHITLQSPHFMCGAP